MTRIAVITANIGNFDEPKGLTRQTLDIDYFYYTENNLPFPLPNLDNRTKSKYIKMQTHRFLPQYDIYIWLDGSINVNGGNFVEAFIDNISDHDIAIYKHQERKNVYEELDYINSQMNKGNHYLLSRYGNQQLMKEFLFYAKNKLPEEYPLFNCYTFIRKNNDATNKCFDEWWRRSIEFSNFDQAMFSFVTWENKININQLEIDPIRTHKLFTREPHKQNGKNILKNKPGNTTTHNSEGE